MPTQFDAIKAALLGQRQPLGSQFPQPGQMVDPLKFIEQPTAERVTPIPLGPDVGRAPGGGMPYIGPEPTAPKTATRPTNMNEAMLYRLYSGQAGPYEAIATALVDRIKRGRSGSGGQAPAAGSTVNGQPIGQGSGNPFPYEGTDDMKEYWLYREQGGEDPFTQWDSGRRASSAATTTVEVNGSKIPGELVKEAVDLSNRADMLNAQVAELDMFRNMAMDANTGWFQAATLPVRQALQSIGVDVGEDVPLLEAMQAQQNQMALRLRNPESGFGLTGNTSNRDVQFLKDAVAGIEKTPEGNRAVLTIMGAKQRRDAFLSSAKADYIFANGTLAGWNDYREQIVESTPFFAADEREFLASLGGGAAAPQGQPGAGMPEPGTVMDGYRFKGGDPADERNWEPVGGGGGEDFQWADPNRNWGQ